MSSAMTGPARFRHSRRFEAGDVAAALAERDRKITCH
jgi:hypothetical protein